MGNAADSLVPSQQLAKEMAAELEKAQAAAAKKKKKKGKKDKKGKKGKQRGKGKAGDRKAQVRVVVVKAACVCERVAHTDG